ncbi:MULTISPECIES: MBL fold metallo-hydrolase [unclassified Brevundimonas]|uniref:MBL fold metallo-hydrolase n=1 Tax=unclassified Brevundimonas TaxID=2622653 RepID=UPI0006F7BCA0|nr:MULTISPECIES: MBL fold metallo-hydrolase [unclassified Brevundimonas]KQY95605.1 phosphoribosyl 1,2-cyclic phosphodiesterase [Brevundimonas sp. Root1423]KRA29270.1 phosphoribosyl 1,2-cyclic phosphodiesterase [Brevundimonas sp. Root608]
MTGATGELEVVILGCGSSGGVPRGDGDWGACDPAEPRNARTRCSLLVRRHGPDGVTSVLIDTSPDLRAQVLAADVRHIDAVLYTHDHADQTHGIDDLRVFAQRARRRLPAWMDAATYAALHERFRYIFESVEGYPAILDDKLIPPHGEAWSVEGAGGAIPVLTFDQAHGPIRSVGYRIGPVAYSSDVSDLDEAAIGAVRGCALWIVDALRWTPHPTHAHVEKALDWIARSGVKRAVLTNLHLDLDYNALKAAVPGHVDVAHDGWSARLSL